jgi:hypothetical protein
MYPTKEFISKTSLLKNLPSPLFAKEGDDSSLWQREVRRDFIINVFILMTLLLTEESFSTGLCQPLLVLIQDGIEHLQQ